MNYLSGKLWLIANVKERGCCEGMRRSASGVSLVLTELG